MCLLVVADWDDYDSCQDPLNVWLLVDYMLFILFRVVQFAFQYANTSPREGFVRTYIPKILAVINLWVVYPFIWIWCVLGCIWYSRSNQCLPESTSGWGFVSWLAFSYIYLIGFGALIWTTYRIRNVEVDSVDALQGLLVQFQRANAYAIDPPRRGLSEEQCKTIPTRTIDDQDVEDMTCSICLQELRAGDTIRTLPCNHLFHTGCLDQWLQVKNTCPNCVQRIGRSEEDEEREFYDNEPLLSGQDREIMIREEVDVV